MTLTLELPPDLEARLQAAARTNGLPTTECARMVLEEHLPPAAAGAADPTIALLRQWREVDATDDPEELRRAEREMDELKAALNANRIAAGARVLFP